MDDLREIQSFILQDKLLQLCMEPFCLQCYDEINNYWLCNIFAFDTSEFKLEHGKANQPNKQNCYL